jgi:hypothetical protein
MQEVNIMTIEVPLRVARIEINKAVFHAVIQMLQLMPDYPEGYDFSKLPAILVNSNRYQIYKNYNHTDDDYTAFFAYLYFICWRLNMADELMDLNHALQAGYIGTDEMHRAQDKLNVMWSYTDGVEYFGSKYFLR